MRFQRISIAAAAIVIGSTLALWFGNSTAADSAVLPVDAAAVSHSIAFFERRFAEDPRNDRIAGKLVDRYLQRFSLTADLADLARASTLTGDYRRLSVDTTAALAREASLLLAHHRFAEARTVAALAVARDSTAPAALAVWFDAALAAGDYHGAEWALRRLPAGALETLVRRAYWADATGEGAAAVRGFGRVCRQLERSSRPAHLRAWCLVELAGLAWGQSGTRAARLYYKEALRAVPGYRGAIEGLADLLHAQERSPEAAALYRSIAVEAHPDLYLRLAEALQSGGDTLGAERALERFIAATDRPDDEPLYGAVLVEYLTGVGTVEALDRAYAIAAREVERRPTMSNLDALSWVLFLQGKTDEALTVSNASRTWGSASPSMDYHRALILQANDSLPQAEHMLAVATADPDRLEPAARRHLRRSPSW